MKITMYELLGMVKDGTQPNHIKYRGEEWWWGYDTYTYFADLERTPDAQTNMFTRYVINYCLDDEVEIIEEEKKVPEKLETYKEVDDEDSYANILKVSKNGEYEIDEATSVIVDKINEILKYLDYLKSKGE